MPLENVPALLMRFTELGTCLVIADIHIGFEESLKQRGLILPSQTDRLLNDLVKIILREQPDTLIILGDIKHQVPGVSKAELLEVPKFFKSLTSLVPIIILPGNHDGGLRDFLAGIGNLQIYNSRGITLSCQGLKIGLLHGHTWPAPELMSADILIMGHTHPVIRLRDSLGYSYLEPVWVKVPLDVEKLLKVYPAKSKAIEVRLRHAIVMPAFNRFLSGNAINKANAERPLLGPLLESGAALTLKSEVFLLDGTYLGQLDMLKETFEG